MLEVNRVGRSPVHEAFAREKGVSLLDPPPPEALGVPGITHLSLQSWGEHCTECAAPDCHDSCDLFERGCVGLCRRFVDGLVVRPLKEGPFAYGFEAIFKPAARLLTVGNSCCVPRSAYRRQAAMFLRASRTSYLLQSLFRFLPARLHWRITDKIRGVGNMLPRWLNLHAASRTASQPDALVGLVGNPNRETVALEVCLSGFGDSQGGRQFRKNVAVEHGWHKFEIAVAEISQLIDLRALFRVVIMPLMSAPALLQFLYVGFLKRAPGFSLNIQHPTNRKIKLLVVDLDNTLWDGIIVEDPDRDYTLRPGVWDTLRSLDERGILLSIASKNNFDDARRVLEKAGIWDLFLYPEISWDPKSTVIKRIVDELNIGMDTVAFVDDSDFERAEVAAALPDVRTFDAVELAALPGLADFQVPVSEDSARRRQLYREEGQRRRGYAESATDYEAFLSSCGMELKLLPLDDNNMDRVFELVQRTNQLNFSGNRYTREMLCDIVAQDDVAPVVMRCRDKFGDYGIVGFALLEATESRLVIRDLMFSCRVQGKRVEHGFLGFVVNEAGSQGLETCTCTFHRTQRNGPAGQVFADLGFEMSAQPVDNVEKYECNCSGRMTVQVPVTVYGGDVLIVKRNA